MTIHQRWLLSRKGGVEKMTYTSLSNMKVNTGKKYCLSITSLPCLHPKLTWYTCLLERVASGVIHVPWMEIRQQYQWMPFAVKGYLASQATEESHQEISRWKLQTHFLMTFRAILVTWFSFHVPELKACKAGHKTQTLNQREISLNPGFITLYFVTSQGYWYSKACR